MPRLEASSPAARRLGCECTMVKDGCQAKSPTHSATAHHHNHHQHGRLQRDRPPAERAESRLSRSTRRLEEHARRSGQSCRKYTSAAAPRSRSETTSPVRSTPRRAMHHRCRGGRSCWVGKKQRNEVLLGLRKRAALMPQASLAIGQRRSHHQLEQLLIGMRRAQTWRRESSALPT